MMACMSQYEKHVFVCTNGPYCCFDGDPDALVVAMKRRVAALGLADTIRINRSGCLNQCGHGPMVVVYPEAVWYAGVMPDDAQQLVDEHLVGQRPVEQLRYVAPPGNNKRIEHYPEEIRQFKQYDSMLEEQRAAQRNAILDRLASAEQTVAVPAPDAGTSTRQDGLIPRMPVSHHQLSAHLTYL